MNMFRFGSFIYLLCFLVGCGSVDKKVDHNDDNGNHNNDIENIIPVYFDTELSNRVLKTNFIDAVNKELKEESINYKLKSVFKSEIKHYPKNGLLLYVQQNSSKDRLDGIKFGAPEGVDNTIYVLAASTGNTGVYPTIIGEDAVKKIKGAPETKYTSYTSKDKLTEKIIMPRLLFNMKKEYYDEATQNNKNMGLIITAVKEVYGL